MSLWEKLCRFAGIESGTVSAAEKTVSALGGFVGILLVLFISSKFVSGTGATLVVASMGASAVLLFAVPHGKLSQPWALIGGQTLSALCGVSMAMLDLPLFVDAALAVGLAIGIMHVFRCVHPPGGATALVAAIGGESVHQLGYQFVLTPVLLNTLVIFMVAVIFNLMFPWRRYPVSMMRYTDKQPDRQKVHPSKKISEVSINHALREMDIVVDLATADLQKLIALSLEHAASHHLSPEQIRLGHFYTNGKAGHAFAVRQIIDESASEDPARDMVIYRVVEGAGIRSSDSCTRSEFAAWAAREVVDNH